MRQLRIDRDAPPDECRRCRWQAAGEQKNRWKMESVSQDTDSCGFTRIKSLFYFYFTAKGAKIAKTMLLQLCVLCGVLFHKLYILIAMAAPPPHPPPTEAAASMLITPGAGCGVEQEGRPGRCRDNATACTMMRRRAQSSENRQMGRGFRACIRFTPCTCPAVGVKTARRQ